jgi:rhodanese-related sulfurtransferase
LVFHLRWLTLFRKAHRSQATSSACATGNRSTVAAKILIDNGFKRIFNLRRGISGWERDKHPVVQ